MKTSISIFLVVVGLVLVTLGLSAFTVDERQHALKLRFGEIVGKDYEPGLHFKIPVYNEVIKFSNQVLTIAPQQPEDILTTEKKPASVDFFLKYRISDPETYYVSAQGSELVVSAQLLQIIRAAIRTEFAKRTMQEVISLERNELMQDMMADASALANELGISLIDVRVKRVEFSDRVSESVYNRMREERSRIAQQLRAEGAEEAVEIRATADRESTVIRSEAYRDAQQIRGEGDARAAAIYASAYNADREFYAFYRSLEAYRNSLGSAGDLLVLDPDSDFFRYLNNREAN
ncbi:MAG: protease modulator HflC [Pseudomonadota bacterium]